MFHQRLRAVSALLFLLLALLIGRLTILQLLHGRDYDAKARELLIRRPEWLETVRGAIFDRHGRVLAEDQLGFRVSLHYKLLRLYDERFWRYQELDYLNQEKHENADRAEVEKHLQQQWGNQRRHADQYLVELADICDFSMDDLHAAIDQLNDEIFAIRALRALNTWSRNHKQPPLPVYARRSTIMNTLKERIPGEYQRLRLVYRTEIQEMYIPQPVLGTLSRETALMIEDRFVGAFLSQNSYNRPISVSHGKIRNYPHDDAACHLIGQLGPVSHNEKPLDRKPTPDELKDYYWGDRMGTWGAECLFEDYLRGHRGWIRKDVENNVLDEIPRKLGDNVTMTIDIRLQKQIQSLLAETELVQPCNGAAVVIDVPTGEVLAAVSVPAFNLNTYFRKDHYKLINEIGAEDPRKRWINRALEVRGNYQTGSTIKPTVLLGALENAIVDPHTSFYCSLDNKTWSGLPDEIHNDGLTDARKAIKVSCNFYFVRLGIELGGRQLVNWLYQSGFGRTILAWPGPDTIQEDNLYQAFREATGHISPIGQDIPRLPVEIRLMSIGRGPLDASVLQLANSAATIARDGIFLEPVLVRDPPPTRTPSRIANIENVQAVQEGMWSVVNEAHYGPDGDWDRGGTAYQAFQPFPWNPDDLTVYGKTGSTENSLFICFARGHAGQCLAVAVLIETEAHGSVVAAPLARDILKACSEQGYLPAPLPPEPEESEP